MSDEEPLPRDGFIRTLLAGAAGLGRHDKASPASGGQVAVKVRYPQVVAVGDVFVFVDARQAKGQAPVPLYFFGGHRVDVERRVGHHEVDIAPEWSAILQAVRIVVEGIGLQNVALQAMHGQVHFGKRDGGAGLLLAVEGDTLHGVLAGLFNEMAALHKHAPRPARQISHHPMGRFNHIDQGLYQ
jgi:hypothetical protein